MEAKKSSILLKVKTGRSSIGLVWVLSFKRMLQPNHGLFRALGLTEGGRVHGIYLILKSLFFHAYGIQA